MVVLRKRAGKKGYEILYNKIEKLSNIKQIIILQFRKVPYKWSKRELTNAVLYLVDSGSKWRQLQHDFPPYSTVHSFYRRARITGLWNAILQHLVKTTRKNNGRKEEPSYGIIDSQSVKTVAASEQRGFDGGKKQKDANDISSSM